MEANFLIITSSLLILLILTLIALIISISLLRKSNIERKKLINNCCYNHKKNWIPNQQICHNISKRNMEDYNLSSRQMEIINLVKQEKKNKEIGAELYISENTVKYHLKTIYNTLEIKNRMDLMNI